MVVLNIQLVAGQEMAEHGKVKKMIAAIGRLAESFGAPSVDWWSQPEVKVKQSLVPKQKGEALVKARAKPKARLESAKAFTKGKKGKGNKKNGAAGVSKSNMTRRASESQRKSHRCQPPTAKSNAQCAYQKRAASKYKFARKCVLTCSSQKKSNGKSKGRNLHARIQQGKVRIVSAKVFNKMKEDARKANQSKDDSDIESMSERRSRSPVRSPRDYSPSDAEEPKKTTAEKLDCALSELSR